MEVIIDGKRFIPEPSNKKVTDSLGNLIFIYRQSKKETLAESAKNIGISKSYLWELEDGRCEPSLSKLQCILDYFGIDYYNIAKEPSR